MILAFQREFSRISRARYLEITFVSKVREKKKEERNDEQGIGSYLVSLDAACKMDDDSTWKMHDTRANLHNQQHPTVYSK